MQESTQNRHVYVHEPLPAPRWTRVLHLEAGEPKDPIRCVVELIDLDDASHPPYIALSYRWGDPNDITTIEVSGEPVSITVNLHGALRRLRAAEHWSTFWADALSISQVDAPEDREEKGAQVQMMSSIFPSATEVVVDLGEDGDLTGAALKLMHQLAKLPQDILKHGLLLQPDFHKYGLPHLQDPAWNAWMALKCRPWFNRVWMVQEFALARQLTIMTGPHVFDGAELEIAHERSSGVQPPSAGLIDGVLSSENSLKGLQTMILVKNLYQLKQKLRLADLFGLCSGFMSTDERDHIYALLGLVKADDPSDTGQVLPKDEDEDELKVNYNEPTPDLAVRFAKYLARRRPSSLIWTFASGPQLTSNQPSWTPNLQTTHLRTTAEDQFPTFEDQQSHYAAAGKTQAHYTFLHLDNHPPTLQTQAFPVDTITALSDTFDFGFNKTTNPTMNAMGTSLLTFEHSARQLFVEQGFPPPFDESTGYCSESYWRTLISDGDGETGLHRAPASIVENFRAFATAANMLCDGRMQVDRDIDDDPTQMAVVMKMAPYVSALARAMFRRKVCVTKGGRVGNVPSTTAVGDELVVVMGVERPLVMRSVDVEDADTEHAGHAGHPEHASDANDTDETKPIDLKIRKYQYVGTAHVHGVMDGELFLNSTSGSEPSLKARDIRVV